MTEKELFEAIRQAAGIGGWMLFHPYMSIRSTPGFPDLVLVRGREVIYAELKTEKGQLRHEQQVWIAALNAAGQRAEVWRPKDLDRVLAELLRREAA